MAVAYPSAYQTWCKNVDLLPFIIVIIIVIIVTVTVMFILNCVHCEITACDSDNVISIL